MLLHLVHGAVVDPQLRGDRVHTPVLDEVIAKDLGIEFFVATHGLSPAMARRVVDSRGQAWWRAFRGSKKAVAQKRIASAVTVVTKNACLGRLTLDSRNTFSWF